MRSCFPEGREILDYYHCAEHVYKVAKAQYGEGTMEALQWAESTISRLFFAEVKEVNAGMRRMNPRSKEAQEEMRKLIGYLQNNREKIHYRCDRKRGCPIGSWGIESANKFISHTRLKRSRAWSVKQNGNAMLRIRCATYSGTYDRVFDRYKSPQLNQNQVRSIRNG